MTALLVCGLLSLVTAVPTNLRSTILSDADASDPHLPIFHFVPTPHNWLNDPNGMFYDPVHDLYHIMFQYLLPYKTWGHAVSKDLIHWKDLPIALLNDEWYDNYGVWTGSATLLDDADKTPVLSYSVSSNDMQAIAFPKNRSDPYLIEWVKYEGNPVITGRSPNGTAPNGRDDTTAWKSENNTWLMAYGTSSGGANGAAVVFQSPDFKNWTILHELYSSDTTGMWECPDFFAIPQPSSQATHVVKASTMGKDYWVTGTYDKVNVKFIPSSASKPMGDRNQVFDLGSFYACKSFFDSKNNRQINYGWVLEERQNSPGWQSTFSMARDVKLSKDGVRLVSPPISEYEKLRQNHVGYASLQLSAKEGETATVGLKSINGKFLEVLSSITASSGADCGFIVRADLEAGEFTEVGVSYPKQGGSKDQAPLLFIDTTFSSNDQTSGVARSIVTAEVLFDVGQTDVELRVFVDASVIEAYVNGGMTDMTRRVYPLSDKATEIHLFARGGTCEFSAVDGWEIAL